MSTQVYLAEVKILRTGADGGHLYIKGRGEVPGQGECDIYAYFASKQKEREFERLFTGQPVVIEGQTLEFTHGIGGSMRQIMAWTMQ